MNLSVIVAAQDGGPSLRQVLSALAAQQPPVEMEVLVADGSGRPEVEALAKQFPAFRFLRLSPPVNVPKLWNAGLAVAQAGIVALTIENCIPAPDWASRMIAAHSAECSAVGGSIAIDPGATLADWAVYFSRYSNYMPPFAPRFLDDLPGDNTSYKRAALDPVMSHASDGFWETFVNHEMRRRGDKLLSDPAPLVTWAGGLSAWRFFRRRYLHGRYFAARRSRNFTLSQRLMRAAGFIAVPPLLLRRTVGRVWKHGRHRAKFLLALPLVVSFLLAWSVGEAAGYLAGPCAATPPARD